MVSIRYILLLFLCCLACHICILTNQYGGGRGSELLLLNQGRVSGILWWGINKFNAISIKNWTSDQQNASQIILGTSLDTNCTSFILSNDEYINGYRLIYSHYIRYIGFHTFPNNNTYICNISTADMNTYNDLNDTNWIIFENLQLTGFRAYAGSTIDSISFQFKDVINTKSLITDDYGWIFGDHVCNLFDIGKINGIHQWGYSNYQNYANSIIISNLTTDTGYTLSQSLGTINYYDTMCTPFSLSTDEYIDGYRVKHSDFVHYIAFHSSYNKTYECGPPTTNATDTGWIIISPIAYLSGFWVRHGGVIDSISFQFTYYPTPAPTQATWINCDSDYSCDRITIRCPNNTDCIVECSGDHACYASLILCPINYGCTVLCRHQYSCQLTEIDAINSTQLAVSTDGNRAAQSSGIRCPVDGIGNALPKCTLTGTADLDYEFITLYAVDGFNDVQINCTHGNQTKLCVSGGHMYYGDDYIYQCDLIADGTGCINGPTGLPTNSPINETTQNPSNYPTIYPSNHPSVVPSSIPTGSPTKYPTVIVINYGVTVSVTFQYEFKGNDTGKVIGILEHITRNIVNQTVVENCIQNDDYGIMVTQKQNVTIINATIYVCDIESQDQLLVAIRNESLEQDLVQNIKAQTNISLSREQLDVDTNSIAAAGEVQTTEVSTTIILNVAKQEQSMMEYYLIIGPVILIVILVIVILGVLLWRKKKLKASLDQKELVKHNNTQIVSNGTSLNDKECNTQFEHDIHRKSSVELMYQNNNNNETTKGNEADLTETTIGNEENTASSNSMIRVTSAFGIISTDHGDV